jgi:hypothetical protein
VLNWLKKKLAENHAEPAQEISDQIPLLSLGRTHAPLMKTSARAHSHTESMLHILSAKDLAQLNQNAAEQLAEMQKDPDEWESFIREIDLFSNGYFQRGD